MYRRSLLAAAGTVAAGLTGCLTSPGGNDGDGGGTETPTTSTTSTPTATPTTSRATTAADPFRTVTVGDPGAVAFPETHRPHVVDVVNDAGPREIGVGLRGGPSFRETVAFPAGGRLRLRLVAPVDRELVVDPPGADPARVSLPAAYVDCNDSRTTVTVAADGSVRHETASTEQECPPAAIVDRSFDASEGECAGGDAGDAAIGFADGTVTATGSLRTPTPCHGAALEAATVDDGILRIVVAATDPDPGTICVQCVGRVPYEATVTLEHDYPDTVVVEHVVDDRRREVARASPSP